MLRILFVLFLTFSAPSLAKKIEVVVGWDKPPYVMQYENSGFEVELTRRILLTLGHEMVPVYVPFGRTVMMVEDGEVDMGLTMSPNHNIDPALLTDVYVVYQNVAISLSSRQLQIEGIASLAGLSVLSFQTAREVLGDDFRKVIDRTSGYVEVPIQSRQLLMLTSGAVEVAILDRNIFSYLHAQLPEHERKPVTIHELFAPIPCSAAIRDPQLRQQFNSALAEFIKDGRYQALLDEFGLVNLLDRI